MRTQNELLEFPRLQALLAGFSTCAPGRRAIEGLDPSLDRHALEAEFRLIEEAAAYIRGGAELGFGSLADPQEWLRRLGAPATVLGPGELLDAASLLDAATAVKAMFREESAKFPRLYAEAAALGDFRNHSAAIRRAILPNGEISDDASPALRRIRAAILQSRERIQRELQQILRVRGEEQGGDYVTVRNGRFVIPVRSAERRLLPGLVHGASATGQTLFIEPLATVELNNRIVQLGEEEAGEIARILTELTELLRTARGPIEFAAESLGHLDSIFSRGRYARKFDCVMPRFREEQSLRLVAARNPVLEDSLGRQGRTTVPISLSLGGGETVMVISGPNTGGKTVTLKTAGLAVLAAQCGIPVPADEAELALFDQVLVDIGDEQSITADLSTFSAHMVNLKRMIEVATANSLVLVDEMGTGTAPEEGAALAVAMLEEFRARGCLTIATTHHDRLKAYATSRTGIVNAAVEFDEVNLRPTYRLLVGVPGVSSGIEIARRLGLPERVIERARAGLSPEIRESGELIAYLHRSRDEVEELKRNSADEFKQLELERRSLQTEWVARQRKRLAELEAGFAGTVKRLEGEVGRLTAEIAERKTRAQMEKTATRRLRESVADARGDADAAALEMFSSSQQDLGEAGPAPPRPVEPASLQPGVRVQVRGFKQPAIYRRNDGRLAEVEAGSIRMRVPLADILGAEDAGTPKEAAVPRRVTVNAQATGTPPEEEINLIGMTVEEATSRADKFLDDSALANRPRIRIIHGHGTGALRRGLAHFLSEHPLVEKFYEEEQDRGGQAITVVELKG
jgi:DNA mismatch repair protein MutS2